MQAGEAVFGTGMMVDLLKHVGTTDWARERLNMVVNTGASCAAQDLSTLPDIPSGPDAFLVFTLINAPLTSCSVTVRAHPSPADELAAVPAGEPTLLTPAIRLACQLTLLLATKLADELVSMLLAAVLAVPPASNRA